ncbi:MAG: LD-carboxypeptidase [Clostridia bacterium]|nr:LD-carboxypeptidase [Clostridia bacterium]
MGATFQNLYVRLPQEALRDQLIKLMKKRGLALTENGDAAQISFSVHSPAGCDWIFLTADSDAPVDLKRLGRTLARSANAPVLYAACEDSDTLQLTLCAGNGERADLKIDVCKKPAQPKPETLPLWQSVIADLPAFINAARTEYTFAEEFLFTLAPLLGMPDGRLLRPDEPDPRTGVMYFAKKGTDTAGKSVPSLLSAGLRTLGFEKHKAAYYKPIDGEFGLAVRIQKNRKTTIWTKTATGISTGYGTQKTAYDIRVAITNRTAFLNDWFLGVEMRFIAKLQQLDLIADLRRTPEEVADLLLRAFREYAYDPLFQNEGTGISVFDIMCGWEMRAFGHVSHNDYTKALAAYREGKYESALFCLKWIFNQNLVAVVENMTDEKARALTDAEIEALRASDRYDRLKNCFALYDRIRGHAVPGFRLQSPVKKPPRLQPGDTVGIVSPCSTAERDKIEATAITLKAMGFRVKFARNLFSNTWGFAGSAEERADDFNFMLIDDSVKMILFGGGEVGNHLLPRLNYGLLAARPKILCSYSDSTTILNAVTHLCGLVTFYGASPRTFSNLTAYNRQSFSDRLIDPTLSHTPAAPWKTIVPGVCEGVLAGGYLVNYATLCGLRFYPSALDGCILLIEDHEMFSEPAVVSKYFANLEHRGVFARAVGLLFGHYSSEPSPLIDEILLRVGERFHIPVARCEDFGHGENNAVFPLGVKARLDTERGSLTYLETAVL